MSVFGSIMSAIFGSKPAGAQAATPSSSPASGGTTAASPAGSAAGQSGAGATGGSSPGGAAGPGGSSVDVAAVLSQRASQKGEKLDWRHSIVDLMKVLDLDSSLASRKALAQELHYSGDMNDSAAMNVWLHKQVMQKLAENGGSVPAELKH